VRDPDAFTAVPWRRRLLILLAAVVTASTVLLTMLYPPAGIKRKPQPPDAPRCVAGQTQACVGGMASVILAPPPPPPPSPSPASAPR